MINTDPVSSLPAAYDVALRQREFEIAQLTNRNNFFMVFQGVLLAGLIQSQGQAAPIVSALVCVSGFTLAILQAAMAAGAKFWQIRWESAVRSVEVELLIENAKFKTVQAFTADYSYLSKRDLKRLHEGFKDAGEDFPFTEEDRGGIRKRVRSEVIKNWLSYLNPAALLILAKPSVSRIPIWVGFVLALVWGGLIANLVVLGEQTLWQHFFGGLSVLEHIRVISFIQK